MRAWVRASGGLWLLGILSGCSAGEEAVRHTARREELNLTIEAPVTAGREEYVCRYFVVPDGGFRVARFAQQLDPRSHHLLVFRTSLTAADVRDDLDRLIHDCDSDLKSHAALQGILHGAQPGEAELHYPEGVTLELVANEVLLVEHHVVNDSSTEISTHAELTLLSADEHALKNAGLFHFYDGAIDVPPLARATTRMRCAVAEPLELIFLHGHMHQRGRAFHAWVRRGTELLPLFESKSWNAPTQQLEPVYPVLAGDAIEFECEYENSGSTRVRAGLSARDDEMCSLSAAYVTARGERLDPLAEGCGLDHSGIIGQGTLGCSGIEACLANAVDSTANVLEAARVSQPCWLRACPDRAIAFQDLALCRYTSCAQICGLRADTAGFVAAPSDPAACGACVDAHCGEPSARCTAAGCEP